MKRFAVVAGAVVGTTLLATVAFWLGAVGFDARRFSQHEGRLRRLVEKKPQADLVLRAFADEGTALVASPKDPAEVGRFVAERGVAKSSEIQQKAARWARTCVFAAGDVLYFVYFDADGVLRDYTVVDRR